MPKISFPTDTAGKILVLSPALLYTGIGVGLPLLLSNRASAPTASSGLFLLGVVLLVVGAVVPPVLLCIAAHLLRAKVWLYALVSIIFWPLGTFLGGINLWGKRPNQG